jgi:HSF-type DNA-binding
MNRGLVVAQEAAKRAGVRLEALKVKPTGRECDMDDEIDDDGIALTFPQRVSYLRVALCVLVLECCSECIVSLLYRGLHKRSLTYSLSLLLSTSLLLTLSYSLSLLQLMEILDNKAYSDIISWLPHGRGFIIFRKKSFEQTILPKYFNKQSKYSSFTRKLNRWGFVRVTRGPETGAYYHANFKRGDHRSCVQMSCQSKRQSGSAMQQSSLQTLFNAPLVLPTDLGFNPVLAERVAYESVLQRRLEQQVLQQQQQDILLRQALLAQSSLYPQRDASLYAQLANVSIMPSLRASLGDFLQQRGNGI